MLTTSALGGVLVVLGCALGGLLLVATVLARLASRFGQSIRVDLKLLLLRFSIVITPTRSRNVIGPTARGDKQVPPRRSEKSS